MPCNSDHPDDWAREHATEVACALADIISKHAAPFLNAVRTADVDWAEKGLTAAKVVAWVEAHRLSDYAERTTALDRLRKKCGPQ